MAIELLRGVGEEEAGRNAVRRGRGGSGRRAECRRIDGREGKEKVAEARVSDGGWWRGVGTEGRRVQFMRVAGSVRNPGENPMGVEWAAGGSRIKIEMREIRQERRWGDVVTKWPHHGRGKWNRGVASAEVGAREESNREGSGAILREGQRSRNCAANSVVSIELRCYRWKGAEIRYIFSDLREQICRIV